jgi:hypothetical protein
MIVRPWPPTPPPASSALMFSVGRLWRRSSRSDGRSGREKPNVCISVGSTFGISPIARCSVGVSGVTSS